MSASLKAYRKEARKVIRDLLVGRETTQVYYINKVNLSKTENEVSRILASVREEL